MIGIALKVVFGWAKEALSFLLGLIREYPWQCALAVALAACWWLYDGKQDMRAERDAAIEARATDRKEYKTAQMEATARAFAEKKRVETIYKEKADVADKAHATELDSARAAADRYIAANRVRRQIGSAPSATPTPGQGGAPGVPESMPTGDVMVSEGDVQACTAAITYAIAAHNWAIDLPIPDAPQ